MNRTLERVKIARVSTVAFFVETQLHAQISGLVEAGAEVTVIASEPSLVRPIAGASYVSVNIPRKISLREDARALVQLFRVFRAGRFDVVHSTTPKAGLLCAVAGALARVPVRLHTFTGQPWVGLEGVTGRLSKMSDRLIARLNTFCFADSPSQRKFIVEQKVVSAGRIGVLGAGSLAGIDLERFSPSRYAESGRNALRKELALPESGLILLFVGRLNRDKGLRELLAAFQEMLTQDPSLTLVLAGPVEKDMEASLRTLPADVKERIRQPGYVLEPEKYMAVADILVIPSYREGFGTVVIEAAAMGLPTVGTDIYGLSDAIIDGETGILVPVKNSAALAAALRSLLADEPRRREMGIAARKRVEQQFSEPHMTALLIERYLNFLEKQRL